MTLAKTNSRPIEVDGVRFRYAISRSALNDSGEFALQLTVQIAEGRGCVLTARTSLTRDAWLDFPDAASAENYLRIKPVDIATVIKRALASGWEPGRAGRPFRFTDTIDM